MPRCKTFLVVAAFDFGTTYSGYAYSYRNEPTKVLTNQNWYPGGASSQLVTLKTPTSVLLDDKEQFHSFGFEAEDHFAALAEENKHKGWRLFRRFKMLLYNNEKLSRQTTVEDLEGKAHPAMEIFAMAIKYLHRHLLDALQLKTLSMRETDIQYVITVPAIWDVGAKQFMREAAVLAGIDGDRLEMAFESEVAAIWCTHAVINGAPRLDIEPIGSKYIVIDLGGGTADITVHQTLPNGTVRVLHKARGGAWGGTYVDRHFCKYLGNVLGKHILGELCRDHIGDYFELIRDFETKKRTIVPNTSKIQVRLPCSLLEIVRNRNASYVSHFMNYLFGGASPVQADKLCIESYDLKAWFEKPLRRLIEHLKELMGQDNIKDIRTVLLVGGFGESRYVQDRLREELVGIRLVVPHEPGLAVLKGAVLFGHNPGIVASRVMTHTYGISLYKRFDITKHPVEKNETC